MSGLPLECLYNGGGGGGHMHEAIPLILGEDIKRAALIIHAKRYVISCKYVLGTC